MTDTGLRRRPSRPQEHRARSSRLPLLADVLLGPVRVLADGFGTWLQAYLAALEGGRYHYDPDELWVVPVP
jgi:hypothetical protein